MLPNSPAGRRPGVGPDGGDGLGVGAAWLGRVEPAAVGGSSPRSARSAMPSGWRGGVAVSPSDAVRVVGGGCRVS